VAGKKDAAKAPPAAAPAKPSGRTAREPPPERNVYALKPAKGKQPPVPPAAKPSRPQARVAAKRGAGKKTVRKTAARKTAAAKKQRRVA
jgi:hypothetical protein